MTSPGSQRSTCSSWQFCSEQTLNLNSPAMVFAPLLRLDWKVTFRVLFWRRSSASCRALREDVAPGGSCRGTHARRVVRLELVGVLVVDVEVAVAQGERDGAVGAHGALRGTALTKQRSRTRVFTAVSSRPPRRRAAGRRRRCATSWQGRHRRCGQRAQEPRERAEHDSVAAPPRHHSRDFVLHRELEPFIVRRAGARRLPDFRVSARSSRLAAPRASETRDRRPGRNRLLPRAVDSGQPEGMEAVAQDGDPMVVRRRQRSTLLARRGDERPPRAVDRRHGERPGRDAAARAHATGSRVPGVDRAA